MARPKGLEPLAHSLEGCCSIQLSYRRSSPSESGTPLTEINYSTALPDCPYVQCEFHIKPQFCPEFFSQNLLTFASAWSIITFVAARAVAAGRAWEHSSVGRALALQARGHRFEPCCSHHLYGPVAQLVRAPACHAGGREFEPLPGRHNMPW